MGEEKQSKETKTQMDEELALKLAEIETHQMLERLANREQMENENERVAQQVQEELNREIEGDELKKKKEASKRLISKNSKQNEDKKRFMDFLKTRGYNGKQLGPMKNSNLSFLYHNEKKKLKAEEEMRRVEEEKLIKAADVGATVVNTSTGVATTKRKQIARTGPRSKKAKVTSPVTADATFSNPVSAAEQSTTAPQDDQPSSNANNNLLIILEEEPEVCYVQPLNVKLPNIISWHADLIDHQIWIQITISNEMQTKFQGIFAVVKSLTREDHEDMHKFGVAKYSDPTGIFNGNVMALEYLNMMFAPEQSLTLADQAYSPIVKSTRYTTCGVYSVERQDGIVEFYLVERKYNHGAKKMLDMIKMRLTVNMVNIPQIAYDLLDKIFEQMREHRTR